MTVKMKVVITGGTGFVGSELVKALGARGDEVVVLTRGAQKSSSPELRFVQWDPLVLGAGHAEVDGADAVVHLAGEVLVGRRLTQKLREEARRSRILSTQLLASAMQKAAHPPGVFVSGSAVGYYGAQAPETELNEDAPAGSDFMARLAADWEGAARGAPERVRIVHARLGIVLGENGGALEAMARPFKLFVGGPLGDGKQVVSWIHMVDAVRAFAFCIDQAELVGPVNICAPEPVDNRTLSEILGRVLHRPDFMPVPAAALKLLFGQGAAAILEGQRVLPQKLLAAGFRFSFSDAETAVKDLLG